MKNREVSDLNSYPRILPQWIKFDKKVLKFTAYFQEHVVESVYENYKIRACDILYYLDDDTMQIKEHVVQNSGMLQGPLIKKQIVLKENGQRFTQEDLKIGYEISIYGKKFKIIDCDDFTRVG